MRDYERGQLRGAIPAGVGAAVRTERRRRRWSQDRLADRSGLSRKTIGRVERGGVPDADTLLRLCETLSIPIVPLVPAWAGPDDDLPSLADPLFGYRVRQRRRELGIRLREAAAAAGVSVSTLSRFERLASASMVLLRPIHDDDPDGEVRLDNDGLAKILGFRNSVALDVYCRSP